MWAELPENKHNDAPKNERIYESDLPTFATDVRMEKVGELFGSSDGHASEKKQTHGSGGGGPVEAVWWIKDMGTQWRIKGQAFVVAPDIEGDGEQSSGVRTVKSEVGARMRNVKQGDWSWGKELTAQFGNCSPKMRGGVSNTESTSSILVHFADNLDFQEHGRTHLPARLRQPCTQTTSTNSDNRSRTCTIPWRARISGSSSSSRTRSSSSTSAIGPRRVGGNTPL